MEKLDTREWLLTNGLGSFASGTISDAHTRTYHGWLIAALEPPNQRRLLLSTIEASLEVEGCHYDLGTNYWGRGEVGPEGYRWLQSFQPPPVPTWTWAKDNWMLSRKLLLPHWTCTLGWAGNEHNHWQDITSSAQLYTCHRALVHYQYDGNSPAILTLRPLIGDRFFHHQQRATEDLQFSQVVANQTLLIQAIRPQWSGTLWHLCWTKGAYYPDGLWYWEYFYPEEKRRGLSDIEDLYSPGYLTITLQPGESVTLEARVGGISAAKSLTQATFDQAVIDEKQRFQQIVQPLGGRAQADLFGPYLMGNKLATATGGDRPMAGHVAQLAQPASREKLLATLLYAGDQCLVYRQSESTPTVIAGYPWFEDRIRQTLMALPGLTLTTGRFAIAQKLLESTARYCKGGLIPNTLPRQHFHSPYPSLDISLWWIETLGLYLQASQDWIFLAKQYPTVQAIYKGLMTGTSHNIGVDTVDGLITWNSPTVALTWMDTAVDGVPVTPRTGKVVEINALWYSCLCWAREWIDPLKTMAIKAGDAKKVQALVRQAQRYDQQVKLVGNSLKAFWNPQQGYFYDRIRPDDSLDTSIRPNGILALSLAHCGFTEHQGKQALNVAKARLLTPYGLRSLDSLDPNYQGYYTGNMNVRDRAYHQGTVWLWLLGPFIRAWQRFYGDRPLPLDWHQLEKHINHEGCLGSVSEIFDGEAPHSPQGTVSHALSIAELIRHWAFLYSDRYIS